MNLSGLIFILFTTAFISFFIVAMFGVCKGALIISIILALIILIRHFMLSSKIRNNSDDEDDLTNVNPGGEILLKGVGPEKINLNLVVKAKHLYREGEFYWYELECQKQNGETVWVNVEDDDELTASVVLEKLTLKDLNIKPLDLTKIDDEEKGEVTYNKVRFGYIESDKATFYRNCDDKRAESFYYWDFRCKIIGREIGIEKWGANEYQVFLSQILSPSQTVVLSSGFKEERQKL